VLGAKGCFGKSAICFVQRGIVTPIQRFHGHCRCSSKPDVDQCLRAKSPNSNHSSSWRPWNGKITTPFLSAVCSGILPRYWLQSRATLTHVLCLTLRLIWSYHIGYQKLTQARISTYKNKVWLTEGRQRRPISRLSALGADRRMCAVPLRWCFWLLLYISFSLHWTSALAVVLGLTCPD
jgi:hypothetical protein